MKYTTPFKKIFLTTLVYAVCVASWLTFSPAFYYVTGGIESFPKKWRLFLLLISPLFIVGYFMLLITLYAGVELGYRRYHFTSNETIERITEVTFPKVTIKKSTMGLPSFTGDYSDKFILQMETKPSKETLHKLDSLCTLNKEWSKRENRYTYSSMWGNGLPAPEGENEEDDGSFSLDYYVGGDTLIVSSGRW